MVETMLEKLKDVWRSMPMSVKLIFAALLLGALLFSRQLAALPMALLVDGYILWMLIFYNGKLYVLATAVVCFIVAYSLRRYLPEQSKNLSLCWLAVCTMLAFAYGEIFYMNQNLYVPLPYNFDIPLLLGALPAFFGGMVGNWVKQQL